MLKKNLSTNILSNLHLHFKKIAIIFFEKWGIIDLKPKFIKNTGEPIKG